jgi:hypothetical protein
MEYVCELVGQTVALPATAPGATGAGGFMLTFISLLSSVFMLLQAALEVIITFTTSLAAGLTSGY